MSWQLWRVYTSTCSPLWHILVACEQTLFLEKNSEEREGKRGERACRQTFEAAIPPSCNYLAEHLSVRSLSVNQFRAWVTPGKINGKWTLFEWTSSLIVDFAKSRWSPVRELIWCRSLAFQEIRPCWLTVAKTALYWRKHLNPQDFLLRKEKAFPI